VRFARNRRTLDSDISSVLASFRRAMQASIVLLYIGLYCSEAEHESCRLLVHDLMGINSFAQPRYSGTASTAGESVFSAEPASTFVFLFFFCWRLEMSASFSAKLSPGRLPF
jgi:hypothetical protein